MDKNCTKVALAEETIDATAASKADRPGWILAARRWIDTSQGNGSMDPDDRGIDWVRLIPFVVLHLGCLGVLWVGWSPVAVGVAVGLYAVRMFALTAFYHRYFSHRAYRTHRVTQFVFALIGNSAVQRGPLWWAAHHRHHHRHSDTEQDWHSPVQHGFLRSHMGWFLSRGGFVTRTEQIPDLMVYPELRWLDRYNNLVPLVLAVTLYALGAWIHAAWPQSGTSGAQMLVWGFFVSTIALFHGSVTINSLAHRFGSRRYATNDNSRNNWLLALLTFGEGWHNNHHYFPGAARQGVRWWELDLTWCGLKLMQTCGLVWGLKEAPAERLAHKLPAGR